MGLVPTANLGEPGGAQVGLRSKGSVGSEQNVHVPPIVIHPGLAEVRSTRDPPSRVEDLLVGRPWLDVGLAGLGPPRLVDQSH